MGGKRANLVHVLLILESETAITRVEPNLLILNYLRSSWDIVTFYVWFLFVCIHGSIAGSRLCRSLGEGGACRTPLRWGGRGRGKRAEERPLGAGSLFPTGGFQGSHSVVRFGGKCLLLAGSSHQPRGTAD